MIAMTAWRLTVEGEDWLVKERPGTPGCYDFDWLSGPNPGYGFTSQEFDRSPISEDEMRKAIADFLTGINPETGYLD
ncbi:hypothetical protein [Kineococcus sp. SYSU DK002]|uniref:hypothetical protein n=1 Tax=Kineococcus sp. SYSU DK002 TaxID=3383123 RepID=UPI003D7CA0F8